MTLQTNPCEGSDGVTVTTGNSNANGGTAFAVVNINSGTICAYKTSGAIHGTSSIRMQSSTAANTVLVGWNDTGATSAVARWYENFTTLPTALQQHGVNFRGNAGVTSLARMEIQTDGTIRCVMGATNGSFSSGSLSTGTTYRFEAVATGFNGSSGSITITVYVGESTSSFTSATASGATTSFTCDNVRFGKFNGSGNFDAVFDSLAADIGSSTTLGRFLASVNGLCSAAGAGSGLAAKVAAASGVSAAPGVSTGTAAKVAAITGTGIAGTAGTSIPAKVAVAGGVAGAAGVGTGTAVRVAVLGGLAAAVGGGEATPTTVRALSGYAFAAASGQGRVGLPLLLGEVRTVPAPTPSVVDAADPAVSVRSAEAPTVSVT